MMELQYFPLAIKGKDNKKGYLLCDPNSKQTLQKCEKAFSDISKLQCWLIFI